MARKRREKKVDLSLFEQLAQEFGVELKSTADDVRQTGDDFEVARKLESTAMLHHLHLVTPFVTKTCKRKECGRTFKTNYMSDAYCSYDCTERAIKELTGIEYHGHRPIQERWSWQRIQYEPPLKMTPSAVDALEKFCRQFLADLEQHRANQAEVNQLEPEIQETEPTQNHSQGSLIDFSQEVEPPKEHPEYPHKSPEPEKGSTNLPLLPDTADLGIDLSF